jgi:hypothetical protein
MTSASSKQDARPRQQSAAAPSPFTPIAARSTEASSESVA